MIPEHHAVARQERNLQKLLYQCPSADDGIKSNLSFSAACTSEMTPLTKDSPTLFGSPENHFMVFWERRNSGGSEHPGWPGCKRSAACDDDIEGCLSCSLARKSGEPLFRQSWRPFSCLLFKFPGPVPEEPPVGPHVLQLCPGTDLRPVPVQVV